MVLNKFFSHGFTQFQPQAKHLGLWFAASATMVFITAKMGGIVRLVESALPTVPWPRFLELPPFTEQGWHEAYDEYSGLAGNSFLKTKMGFDDFKYLWRLEFSNQVCKWVMCAAFFVPTTCFLFKGYHLGSTKRMLVLCGLFIYQGLTNWQIVNTSAEQSHRVSQYHLAASFGTSVLSYLLLLKLALEQLLPVQSHPITAAGLVLRRLAFSTSAFAYITAVSGSFVAGLDGGLVYNTFPKMGEDWIPGDILKLSPIMKNFVENPTTAQFDHRILAVSTTVLSLSTLLLALCSNVPRRANYAAISLGLMAVTQASMGIYSLLNKIPTIMTSGHQSGALIVMSCALWLAHELRFVKRV